MILTYFICIFPSDAKKNSSTHSQPSSIRSNNPISSPHPHPAFQTGSTKIPIYVGNRQRSPSVERKQRSKDKSPSPDISKKCEQRTPEDDSSLLSISGMTSDNECESNISDTSGDHRTTQQDIKG